jgi:SAM-dependent methyltransferase
VAEPPSPAQLSKFYSGPEYFANPRYGPADYRGYRDYLADRTEIEAKFIEILERIERHTSPGRLLDVGCGPGLLLRVAAARGWRVEGLDLNPWASAYASEHFDVTVTLGTVETADLDPVAFDAVTMLDLIEHLPSADTTIAAVARALRPGGVLAVLTPIADSLGARLLGRRWPEVQRVPEHTTLYSMRGLRALLRRHGMLPCAHQWIGKRSSLETLLADVAPIAPTAAAALERAVPAALSRRSLYLNPMVKACVYARRNEDGGRRR